MKKNTPALILASLAGLCALAIAQPAKEDPKAPKIEAAQPEMDEMTKQWMALGNTNEHHARFEAMVGVWDATVTMFEPGKEPNVSKGTMVNRLIHGGRYLQHNFKGEFMGMEFTGSGTFGYNNATGKYQGTWIDSMSTGTMVSEGTYDEATKTYTSTGDMDGPGGMKITQRETIKIISNDEHVMEMFHTMPGVPEIKAMEIKYTRKAPAEKKDKAEGKKPKAGAPAGN